MLMRSISLLFTVMLAGCAGSASSQPAHSPEGNQELSSLMQENADSDNENVAGDVQCLDESNDPRQCERDADCCAGFACGWDPQVSRVFKVCVNGGGESTAVAAGSEPR
ncbi:MAG: hypothetical protein JW940_04580 [Polyangiaceae bacterium]|nr:hypothetical protein [Polyangiaceae bacterium]